VTGQGLDRQGSAWERTRGDASDTEGSGGIRPWCPWWHGAGSGWRGAGRGQLGGEQFVVTVGVLHVEVPRTEILGTEVPRTEILRIEVLGTEVLSACTAVIMGVRKIPGITGIHSTRVTATAEMRRIIRVSALRLRGLGFTPGRHILACLLPKLTTGRG
jgi:hypothetical protein